MCKTKSGYILLAHLFTAFSFAQGFVHFTLVKTKVTAFEAKSACTSRGYHGLAVIDLAAKWNFILSLLQYEAVTSDQKMWIGLERNVETGDFSWGNGMAMGWAAWGPGAPANTNTQVAVISSGGVWGWNTDGGNYENWLLCSSESNKMKMYQHPNKNMNLTGVVPLLTGASYSHEECGLTCSTMSACRYVASQPSPTLAAGSCLLYDNRVDAQLNTAGSLNSFTLFTVSFG